MNKNNRQKISAKKLDDIKNVNLGNLLIRAARIYNEIALKRVRQRIDPRVTISHTTLIAYIDLEGTRITELSAKIGITKQAVGQLVFDLETLGVLKRAPDPHDGRAKLVMFTNKGKHILVDGLNILSEIEEELSNEIGEREIYELKKHLRGLQGILDTISHD